MFHSNLIIVKNVSWHSLIIYKQINTSKHLSTLLVKCLSVINDCTTLFNTIHLYECCDWTISYMC